MTNFKRQLMAALSAGAMLLSIASPVAAGTTIVISGNGTNSDNTSTVNLTNTTTVVQSNAADINNDVDVAADTGDNNANENTGGNVTVETGDAEVEVSVTNTANSNSASVDCCVGGDTDVLIEGNGEDSDNDANLSQSNTVSTYQTNYADITNNVTVDAETGENDANENTGAGSVFIGTGDASVKPVEITNTANANWAQVGGNGDAGSSLSVRIVGNGSDSDNTVDLTLSDELALVQSNFADIYNDLDLEADTGSNNANENTGDGVVAIETGDATVEVDVDNAVNFNWADLNCGCLEDVFAKIADNGEDSDNDLTATLVDSRLVFQDNCGDQPSGLEYDWKNKDCGVDNKVNADAHTGENDANENTAGGEDSDPFIGTGDADAEVEVSTSGNSNVYGEADSDFPEFDFDFNLNLSLNLSDLLDFLGL